MLGRRPLILLSACLFALCPNIGAGSQSSSKAKSFTVDKWGEAVDLEITSSVEWDAFSIEAVVSYNDSKRLILGFPISQYWDVHKKSFRTGIIGELIKESNPDLISTVERKVMVNGKLSAVNTSSVELPSILMHSLNAIKFLIDLQDKVFGQIASHTQFLDDVSLRLADLKNEMKLTLEQNTTCRTVMKRINTTDIRIQAKKSSTSYQVENLQFLSEHRKSNLLQSHEILSKDSRDHLVNARQVTAEKQASLKDLYEQEEYRRRIAKSEINKKENQMLMDQLESDINISIDAILFRAEEQGRLDKANEDVNNRITAAEAEYDNKRMTTIINIFFQEGAVITTYMMENPSVVFWWTRTVLLFFIALIIVYEIASSIGVILKSSGATLRVDVVTNKDTAQDQSQCERFLDGVVSKVDTRRGIEELMRSIRSAVAGDRCLSNVLILGPVGCGKSLVAKRIAEASCVGYVVIGGSDLHTLGVKAGLTLQSLFTAYRKNKKRTIVVIDDADTIIADREGDSGGGTRSCLYSLLEILRENSPYYSVYMTSQLHVNDIDVAILDRMDRLVQLSSPDVMQRLDFSIREFKSILPTFMNAEDMPHADILSASASSSARVSEIYSAYIRDYHLTHRAEQHDLHAVVSPETDRPMETTGETTGPQAHALMASYLFNHIDSDTFSDYHFNFQLCMQLLVEMSEGWSFRELAKFFSNVRSNVLGTERCELSTSLWMKELSYMATQPRVELS